MTEPGDVAALVERLAQHRTLGSAPRAELEWLARHGRLRTYGRGETVVPRNDTVKSLYVMFSGHLVINVDRGSGPKTVMEWRGGDVVGILPFSRMRFSPGESVMQEPSEGLEIPKEDFPELVRECPNVTAALVHVMLDRARVFNTSEMHDEKMMSLGRLAAGLAHELNNPASAAVRSARRLSEALYEAEAASRALGAAALTDAQRQVVERVRDLCQLAAGTGTFRAPVEALDREDAMAAWLTAHGLDAGGAPALAESMVTEDALDELAAALSREALAVAIRWVVTNFEARTLTKEIERAVTRVHDLVAAIKRFSYLDQQRTTESIDVAQGIADTVVLLGAKARASMASVTIEMPPGLPRVRGIGGELNQIWLNLLENALDAVAPATPVERPAGARTSGATGTGRVTISAAREGDGVVVRIVDNGPGIPAEHIGRIFDPFFTTKPQGKGTGLGLDIAQKIARAHGSLIEVDSEPGRTEFRLRLNAAGTPASTPAAS